MAKKVVKEKSIEESLWESANKLRGSVEPSEYKHVVLSLIFLKYAHDRFTERRNELVAEGKEAFADQPVFYNAKNVFYLNEASRWDYIMENAKQNDIAIKIDQALATVEKDNPTLKGALPSNYYSGLGLDRSKLAALLDEINKIDTLKDPENDLIGRVYEYFLAKFAIAEGKGKGEYYTPKTIVNLIAEMIQPYQGKIYDPCCGSGGMFVQSMKFIEAHHGNKRNISVYGQEYTNTTYKLAKMNLAIRGIANNLGEQAADTFKNDQHKELKADFIMANPPFNQKAWREDNELKDDPPLAWLHGAAYEQCQLWLDSEYCQQTVGQWHSGLPAGQRRTEWRWHGTGDTPPAPAEPFGRGHRHLAPQHVLLHRHQCDPVDSQQEQACPHRRAERQAREIPQP